MQPVSPHRQVDPAASQILILLLTRLVGTYAIIQGVLIVLGGPRRWQGNPALESALSFPGAPASWGFVALAFGLLALVGTFANRRLAAFGCWGISAWATFFTITLTKNALESAVTPTTGPPTYALVAIIAVALAIPWRARP